MTIAQTEQTIIPSKRIGYIDALRGLTMILVVFSHIYIPNSTPLNQFFILFRMPLFFFISGFISFRREQSWTGQETLSRLGSKVRTMIVPALTLGLLYTMMCNETPIWVFFNSTMKMGYWFTFALFNMLIIYYVSRYIHARRGRTSIECFSKRFFVVCLLIFLLLSDLSALGDVDKVLTLSKSFDYIQFFAFGTLCSCNREAFERTLDNGKKMALVVIGFFAIAWWLIDPDTTVMLENNGLLGHPLMKAFESILRCMAGFLGILTVYGLFRRFGTFFSENKLVGKSLQFVGRNTLDVYLLHYFVLLNFPLYLYPYIVGTNNIACALVVGVSTAIVVVAISLLISRILRLSDHVAYYLLGARDVKLDKK